MMPASPADQSQEISQAPMAEALSAPTAEVVNVVAVAPRSEHRPLVPQGEAALRVLA